MHALWLRMTIHIQSKRQLASHDKLTLHLTLHPPQLPHKVYVDMSLLHGYGTVEGCTFEFFIKDTKKDKRKTTVERGSPTAMYTYKHDIIAFGGRYDGLVRVSVVSLASCCTV